jgi:hypothetical protein
MVGKMDISPYGKLLGNQRGRGSFFFLRSRDLAWMGEIWGCANVFDPLLSYTFAYHACLP